MDSKAFSASNMKTFDEWEIITKAVYLYIALYNMFVGTVII